MYRSTRSVAWRDWDEWRETYRMLYSENVHEIQCGCARVSAWSAKQPLPIAVEVTASLQRELHGERNVIALSLAIVRFINSVVDPFRNATLSVPISTIGTSYGVPDFIIGIHHSATHGHLPTFELAALGASTALDWLKTNYWETQQAELDSLESSFRDGLLQLFLQSRDPFANVQSDLLCSFGISALLQLALNPSQSRTTVSPAFQERVAGFMQQMQRKNCYFVSAFVMEIAAEVAKGNPIAAVWLNFFAEKSELRDAVRLLRWADPARLGGAVAERLIREVGDVSGEVDPPKWPPVSIGSLPVGSQSLTMCDDEWEFVEPCPTPDRTSEPAPVVLPRAETSLQPHESLLEIG
jgi:ribosomal biogenesis protein LAS1